ncbi:MAG: hypothetical protein AAF564_13365 [Bacteroidota bacterium]
MSKTYFYIDERQHVRDARGKRIRPDKQGRYWIRVPRREEPSEEELMFYWWRFVVLLFYPVFWVRDVMLAVFGKASYFERRIETLQSFQGYLQKHEDTLNSDTLNP